MSHVFERPLCDMGKAYDFGYRSRVGDPGTGAGGPCDDYPRRVDLYAATADPTSRDAEWRSFSLCPEHENQLRQYDARLISEGVPTRFRPGATAKDPKHPTGVAGSR
jgi:hypothetical protein